MNSGKSEHNIMYSKKELQKKTNDFLELLKSVQKENIKLKKIQAKAEDKNIKDIQNLFDENKQLKNQLKDIKKELKKDKTKEEIIILKKDQRTSYNNKKKVRTRKEKIKRRIQKKARKKNKDHKRETDKETKEETRQATKKK